MLDKANRRARARQELIRQARERDCRCGWRATRRCARSARSFAMPLSAAGIDASVAVRFVDPTGARRALFLDRPRRIEDVVEDRQADR